MTVVVSTDKIVNTENPISGRYGLMLIGSSAFHGPRVCA